MAFKKGDFLELDFVGKVAVNNQVFDSTIEKKEPVVICIGAGHMFKVIDDELVKKNIGDEFELDLKPEDAFGPRDPKLVQLTNLNIFKQNKINPFPGLQLNIDGALATIRSVNGGRVTMDFNHPLAGKNVKYWVKIRKQVTELPDKIKALCVGWKPEIKIEDKKVEIKIEKKLPEQLAQIKAATIQAIIPELKEMQVKFVFPEEKKEAKKKEETKETKEQKTEKKE